MRFLNGVLLGVLLTIGAAYWHDRNVAPATEHRELVNWDEFSRIAASAGGWLKSQIDSLSEAVHRRD